MKKQPLIDGLQVTLRDAIRLALKRVSAMDGNRKVGSAALQAVMQHIGEFPSRSCWESAETIAVRRGKSARTVESALRVLAKINLIETTGPKTRHTHTIGPNQIARLKAMLDAPEPDTMSDSRIQCEPDILSLNCPVEPDTVSLNCPVEPDTVSDIVFVAKEKQQTTKQPVVVSPFEDSGSEDDGWLCQPVVDELDWTATQQRLAAYPVVAHVAAINAAKSRGWHPSRVDRLIDQAKRMEAPPSHLCRWITMNSAPPEPKRKLTHNLNSLPCHAEIEAGGIMRQANAEGWDFDRLQAAISEIETRYARLSPSRLYDLDEPDHTAFASFPN